ncbi:MAG: hypothetical protein DHS20C18_43560 [Saprospiraceae bacterium]|nr:MAG: hypothetical protein DHS20C18_43560 [Saprospiraceae bacterium]
MKTPLFHLLGFLLLISSCNTELNIEVPSVKQELTVYAFINPEDTSSSIFINRTAGYGEYISLGTNNLPSPATVNLMDGMDVLANFSQMDSSTIYAGAYSPFGLPGQSYLLRAEHPTLGTIEATSIIPEKVVIQKVEAIQDFIGENEENVKHGLEITFDDPGAMDNFYSFSFFDIDVNSSVPVLIDVNLVDILTPATSKIDGINYKTSYALHDGDFNGQSVTLRFEIRKGDGTAPTDKAYIEVRFLDVPEYRHLQSLYAPTNVDLEPFIEPTLVYTNFDRGFGVFSLFTSAVYDVEE